MEPLVYFYGTLPFGFSAYPSDHTRAYFEDFIKRSRNQLQIVVHREDNLLYYGYVRRINNNKFFGICICLDCIYNNVNLLFYIFDEVYANMIKNGDVLKIDNQNGINWAIKNYTEETVALNEYKSLIINRLNINSSNTQKLPPVNFSISINDCLDISLETSNNEILDAIKRYPNVYIVTLVSG